MIVSINQPGYLPWLGYFHRIAMSDLHVVLDHVQFEKNGFTNRNRIRTRQGSTWLTVPVKTSSRFGDLAIDHLEVSNHQGWSQKHARTLEHAYGKAPFFERHRRFFNEIYERKWDYLADLNAITTEYLLAELDICVPLVRSSNLSLGGRKSALVLSLCQEVGASTYLSGPLGRQYLDEKSFSEAGITVRYHEFIHPRYPQAFSGGFVPNMSTIDLLFNTGPRSAEILYGKTVEEKWIAP